MSKENELPNNFLIDLLSTNKERREFLNRIFLLPRKISRILDAIESSEQSKMLFNEANKKDILKHNDATVGSIDLNIVQKKLLKYKDFEEFKADLDIVWNGLKLDEGSYRQECATKVRELVNAFEIEVLPVSKEMRFCGMPQTVEGRDNKAPLVLHTIRKVVVKVLLSVGYSYSSKMALWTLSEVLQNEILKIIGKETRRDKFCE